MPFIPAYTTAKQRQAFANRLAYYINSINNKTSLMALQEGFAKAGGFPDAHAAQAQQQKQLFLFKQSTKQSQITPLYPFRFLGIGPTKLFQWAKESKKKYPHLLQKSPFTTDDAQILLSKLWGHESWEKALIYQQQTVNQTKGILVFEISETLKMESDIIWGQKISGYSVENYWIGQSKESASHHSLIIHDSRNQRNTIAVNQALQRIGKDERIILLDASQDNDVSHAIEKFCLLNGHTLITKDWNQVQVKDMGLFSMPKDNICVVIAQYLSFSQEYIDETSHLNKLQKNSLKDQKSISPIIIDIVMKSINENYSENVTSLPKLYQSLFDNFYQNREANELATGIILDQWKERILSLEYLLGTEAQQKQKLFQDHSIIWKLPPPDNKNLLTICLALSILKEHINLYAIETQSSKDPTAIFSIDIPFTAHPSGWCTVYSQGRSSGVNLLNIQSSFPMVAGGKHTETKASLANIGTFVIGGWRDKTDILWSTLGIFGETIYLGHWMIFSGDQKEKFKLI